MANVPKEIIRGPASQFMPNGVNGSGSRVMANGVNGSVSCVTANDVDMFGTDIAKIARKRSKPDKHRHRNE
ncbi:hypothetical protein Tco_0957639 [Tanacetum coccineum]